MIRKLQALSRDRSFCKIAATKNVHKRLQLTLRGLKNLIFNIHVEFNLQYFAPADISKVEVFPVAPARFLNSLVLRKLPIRVPRDTTPKLSSVHHYLLLTGWFPVVKFVDFFVSFEVQYFQGARRLKLKDKFSLPRVRAG